MIVIIGTGLAGYSLAREIRKLNSEIKISLITTTNGDFYSKPILSNVLTLKKQPAQLVTASVEKMKADLNIEVFNFSRVELINSKIKQIEFINLNDEKSHKINYEKLVFATGSIPNAVGLENVYQVNSLEDYTIWHDQLKQNHVKKIAILGAGLIGCEFANDLIKGGYQVDLIDSGQTPLGRLLPNQAGEFLKQQLIKSGINYQSEVKAKQIKKNNNLNYNLVLESKLDNTIKELNVDLVLGAIGIQPNINLAQQLGLETQKGILTNVYLETSLESVYALGDCAEVAGLWLPYVAPIMQSARALAKTLTGEKTAVVYPNMPIIVKTASCPIAIGALRAKDVGTGEWQFEQIDENNLKALYLNSAGDLLGFILMGAKLASQRQKLAETLEYLIS